MFIRDTLKIYRVPHSQTKILKPEKADPSTIEININCFQKDDSLFLIFTNIPKSDMARSVRMDYTFMELLKNRQQTLETMFQ